MSTVAPRAHRLSALTIAWLLAWQSWGFTLGMVTSPAAASCCCAHQSESKACPCRFCTHAREIQSGERRIKPCGGAEESVLVAQARAVLPPVLAQIAPLPVPRIPSAPLWSALPTPSTEVPTPPPLAG